MEEMSPAVAVPLKLGNSICDNSAIATHIEITRLKLMTDTASLLADPVTKLPAESVAESTPGEDEGSMNESKEGRGGDAVSLEMVPENETSWVANDGMIQESEEDDSLSVGVDQIHDSSCSLSLTSETGSFCGEDFIALEPSCEIAMPGSVETEKSIDDNLQIFAKNSDLGESVIEPEPMSDFLAVSDSKAPAMVIQLPQDKRIVGIGGRSVFELECIPLWGFTSICGRRPEMEDAVAVVPRFLRIPIQLLTGDPVVDVMNQRLIDSTAHFFGVYDGHGGSQVANYCRDRIHSALTEEIESIKQGLALGDESTRDNWQQQKQWKKTEEIESIKQGLALGDESTRDNWQQQKQWEKAFTNCFLKVDAEVGGSVSRDSVGDKVDSASEEASLETFAPETVGSTAVVAVICSSHIIVANCGDSRVVLCRGKEPVPLSVDHKPSREDEYARIEAAGGKVIQWNGYRVFGVLAMSRSIGDRYLKPWIIPNPEVMFIPRTKDDECLVLASDGLWDVMTNEEVCDVARKRIILWHKKNGVVPPAERGEGVDPAAEAAAECLSKLALQKGSKDNITVIVVDLKAQRKFKSRT